MATGILLYGPGKYCYTIFPKDQDKREDLEEKLTSFTYHLYLRKNSPGSLVWYTKDGEGKEFIEELKGQGLVESYGCENKPSCSIRN